MVVTSQPVVVTSQPMVVTACHGHATAFGGHVTAYGGHVTAYGGHVTLRASRNGHTVAQQYKVVTSQAAATHLVLWKPRR
eukprot:2520211-Rhodomonas_salina.8